MVKRKSLAITFYLSYEEGTGVVNYFINMVRALNHLEDEKKPEIVVLHTERAPINDVKLINYPYLRFCNIDSSDLNFFKTIVNRVSWRLTKRNIYITRFNIKVDTLYDFYYTKSIPIKYRQKYHWICDFLHRYFPESFPNSSYKWTEDRIHSIVKNKCNVIVSSKDSEIDFHKFFYYHSSKVKVLTFASVLPIEFKEYFSASPYIGRKYFIVSNQFWPHKDHLSVVKAVADLKSKGIDVLVLFTGHLSNRHPAYAVRVKKLIELYGLEENIIFLGFLDRLEQLSLIKNSVAVIQPSLFEGWSTIVEDCKALDKLIILSDLRVHQEQISQNCIFFSPHEHNELADIMLNTVRNEVSEKSIPKEYSSEIEKFALNILEVFELN